MANELVPLPGEQRPDAPSGNARPTSGHEDGEQPSGRYQIFDPLVPLGYVDTDEVTAGMRWDPPPTGDPRESFEAARSARRHARRAEADAEHARRHGETGFAVLRESDAGDNLQMGWGDWGDLRTWAIIWAMFFGFLLLVAFVYFSPTGRHNQNDGPLSVPAFRGY